MRVVERAENHPGVCIATRDHIGPFVDFECWTEDVNPHIYISVASIYQAAEMLGMIPPSEVDSLVQRLKDLEAKYENLHRFVEAHEKLEESMQEAENAKELVAA